MENTKQKILDEALRLFARDGYEAVSVEQIASAVGIKAPSLYKHYKSKRDIFSSILQRMNELDAERIKKFEMPEQSGEELARAYSQTPVEKIRAYTREQFRRWTQEEFSANFRRLLTLEQYRSPEMAQLYQTYLAGGPLGYMEELFGKMTGRPERAGFMALSFYAPIFLLYSLYDGAEDKAPVLALLEEHIKNVTENKALLGL